MTFIDMLQGAERQLQIEIQKALVAEGVYSARTVLLRARQLGVEMPITQAVVALLDGNLSAQQAVQALMGRHPRGES